jgi:adenine-specific DNA-methyltransferase
VTVTNEPTEPAKVDLETPDPAAANRAAFEHQFPGVLADGVIDAERLKGLLDVEVVGAADDRERYGLMWAGKKEAVRSLQTPSRGTLIPDFDASVDWDTAQNVFVEGDNLEVLKLLQKAYNDQVKLIYIDPPYNTGNDFVYNDDFSDGLRGYLEYSGQLDSDGNRTSADADRTGRKHSAWLTMMYPRLMLARNLLQQDGIIFVSIDDHEIANLRMLMDEVFGPENFLGIVTRSTGTPTGGGFDRFVNMVDYLMVYGRSDLAVLRGLEFGDSDAAIYNEKDERGRFLTRSLRRTGGEDRREDRPSMFFGIQAPDGSEVFPIGPAGYESRWICGRARYAEMVDQGLIAWKNSGTDAAPDWRVYQKFYLEGREKRPSNLWTDVEGNKKATREVRALFYGEKVFETPKPTDLIARVVSIATEGADLVIDFFAGSGTTAHAVARQNAADGGRRRCISVNVPEPTPLGSAARKAGYDTVSAISEHRIKQVMVTDARAKLMGLRIERLASSNFRDATSADPEDLFDLRESTLDDGDHVMEHIAQEVLLKEGVRLDATWERYKAADAPVIVADGVAVVMSLELNQEIADAALALEPRVVVFLEDGFAGADAVKANTFTNAKSANIVMKTV